LPTSSGSAQQRNNLTFDNRKRPSRPDTIPGKLLLLQSGIRLFSLGQKQLPHLHGIRSAPREKNELAKARRISRIPRFCTGINICLPWIPDNDRNDRFGLV